VTYDTQNIIVGSFVKEGEHVAAGQNKILFDGIKEHPDHYESSSMIDGPQNNHVRDPSAWGSSTGTLKKN